MSLIELIQTDISLVLVLVAAGLAFGVPLSRVLGTGSALDNQKLDRALHLLVKLVTWHEPEDIDGGATQRFGWKFTHGEIQSLEEMPKALSEVAVLQRLLLDEIKGLRVDLLAALDRRPH